MRWTLEDQSTPHGELIKEISGLKQRIKELEQSGSESKRAENLLRQEHEVYLDRHGICPDCSKKYFPSA